MTTRQLVTTLVLLALLLLSWWGMRVGWEHRRRRTEDAAPALPAVPDDPGPVTSGPFEAAYVSSTRAGDWLDRVVAHDLGVRSPAEVSVHASGLRLRRGEDGRLGFERSFRFEYSEDGQDRHVGRLVIRGDRLVAFSGPVRRAGVHVLH